ncbi:putative uncharacterized protein C8orf89 homolog [Stigmatopora argus]
MTLPTPETFQRNGRLNFDHRGTGISRPSQTYGPLQIGAPSRRPPLRTARTLASIQSLNGDGIQKKNVTPPQRYGHVHQEGEKQLIGLSDMLLSSHVRRRPFTFSYSERCKPKLSPKAMLPSTLFLRGLNTYQLQNCKTSRAKVNYTSCNLLNLKSQSYPDPLMGASRSFLHRISELLSLEGETAKQEKLKKIRLCRKASAS